MKSKLTWLEVLLLVTPFLLLAFYWNELPGRVPVHWNLHNEIDRWAPKSIGLLLLPLASLGTVVLLHVLPRLDPKLQKRAGEKSRMPAVLAILRVALAGFITALFSMQLFAALGYSVPISRIVVSACLILFAVLGNYLTALRPNYFIGIRTPWTLESPDTWRATHRIGGRLMFFGSLLLFVLQFCFREMVFAALFVGSVIALAIWTFWYSWHHFRALQLGAH